MTDDRGNADSGFSAHQTAHRLDDFRISSDEILRAAADYTRKRERVEMLIREVVEFSNPLQGAWLAQRIVDALESDKEAAR